MNLKAYAKINLGLRILRKREDGFHDIETVFHRVNVFDEIALEPSNTLSMECTDTNIPTDERNLCMRAARLLQQETRAIRGVHIHLKKHIPAGAGLGGGSSDAASTLLGLNAFWNLNLSHEMLKSLAIKLGADVSYFLRNGSAYATGRGELLDYFSLNIPYWIVVAYPNIHVTTSWAYQNTHITHPTSHIPLEEIVLNHLTDPLQLTQLLHNDFEPLVLTAHPAISRLKNVLYTSGAVFAQMSGSGSSVYGFFTSEQAASGAVDALRKEHRVFLTPPNFQPPPLLF